MQPVDPYFTSKWKRKPRPSAVMAAKHRRTWPKGSQYQAQVALEMRGGERPVWWHFLNVALEQAEHELEAWRAANPGFEFRLGQSHGEHMPANR